MSDLDALLAGIVSNPHEGLRWLVLADWLDDHGQPERAELTRLHRELLRTCVEPEAHPERPAIHARIMELMRAGATPGVPRKTLILPGGVELPTVFIPPGSFRMGSPETELERQEVERTHLVRLTQGFFLGVSPVTQAQWVAIMGENPSHFKGDTLPVEKVSWDDAVSFCGKVSELTGQLVRLPTEAEWEYSCRAGTETAFYWGGVLNGTEANCYGLDPYGTKTVGPFLDKTSQVGMYSDRSPHPWGLWDLHGNVLEWCMDWFDLEFYTRSPQNDPLCEATAQNYRVLRGGSWAFDPLRCRAAYRRLWYETSYRGNVVGFRVAVTLN